jgi:hypothetical protein
MGTAFVVEIGLAVWLHKFLFVCLFFVALVRNSHISFKTGVGLTTEEILANKNLP